MILKKNTNMNDFVVMVLGSSDLSLEVPAKYI